jgi:hypothetical protein
MAILNNSNAISSGSYDINNSLRLRASASAYLSRTPGSAGNRKTWTLSGWVKRGQLGIAHGLLAANDAAVGGGSIGFNSTSNADTFYLTLAGVGTQQTSAVFRDPSAWYHIVVAFDTTQATQANRCKLYINGTQYTFTTNIVGLNTDYDFNNAIQQRIGTSGITGSTTYADGYLAEVNFIDGQALTPSSFGETDTTTGSWKPKAYTSTYGTNGFYLKFSDIATTSGSNAGLGKDFSGNTNYWTTNNISVTAGTTYDAMIDSPTLTSATVANYAVMNPLNSTNATITNGNLQVTLTSPGTAIAQTRGTIAPSSGKWYWEQAITTDGNQSTWFGIVPASVAQNVNLSGGTYNQVIYARFDGTKNVNNTTSAYGATYTTGDIIGIALDLDGGTVTFYKNNTSQGSITLPTTGVPYQPVYWWSSGGSAGAAWFNFGQRPFTYTPPTGFVRLNTYNLPDSTIKKGNTVMDATLYTGTGSSLSVTNAGAFKPDLVWIKKRNGVMSPILMDSRRGTSLYLTSDSTNADVTDATVLTSFNSNGFTLGTSVGSNGSGGTFVGWQWQAGQGSTSSNTSGTITSTVSVNATAGFSVVTYTGTGVNATVGHGLGVAPKMIIAKGRSSVSNWLTYHESIGNTKYLLLNTTDASATASTAWNNTSPTSNVFSLGTAANGSGTTFVAYCWSEIAGFSKFGSYTGNGSADGPFVYTGFRPKYVMWKRTDASESWVIEDTTRNPSNVANAKLYAQDPTGEDTNATYGLLDILSNGFKCRTSHGQQNASGGTYIYMAFAENPFKNANAR